MAERTMTGGMLPDGDSSPDGVGDACGENPGLEIRLFGPMDVRIGSRPLPHLRSRKGLWLLALLALRAGRDVERDWLAGSLWPDCDEADGRHSLRQTLYDLRRALGSEAGRLAAEGPRTLRLDLSGVFVDLLAFDAAISRGDPDSLEAAVRVYRGPLLEDCTEEWSLEARQQREQAFMGALERLAEAAAARGEHAAAANYLRLAVGADPYREDLQRSLMQALAEGGSPAGALLVYREFRALLGREMAAEPGEETTALFRRLRDETRARAAAALAASRLPSPAPPSPVRRSLPLRLTELIGREDAVRDVIACLAGSRLLTLTGSGGIGKTRLAVHVAEELEDEYAEGAWFVDLAPLVDPQRVPEAVRTALDVPPGDGREDTLEVLRRYLSPRRLLLVLDNCEHLLNACAALAEELLGQCTGLRILATSRQPLGAQGEAVWRVPPLPAPEEDVGVHSVPNSQRFYPHPLPQVPGGFPPGILSKYPAVRLFVARARAAEASFEMTPRNAAAIAAVCRRLGGIPLAIELAAARVSVMAVEQIAQRLDDRFRLLTGGSRTALPRHQTLRAAMDWSHELLSEAERTLLRRLSVFAGGWTLEAAEAVGAGIQVFGYSGIGSPSNIAVPNTRIPEYLDTEDVLDLLTSLVEKSLVGVERREGAARFVLLETTREYARERLREAGEDAAVRARHAEFFLDLAERAEPELHGPAQAEWLQQLEEEHDNFRTALDWLAKAEGGRMKAEGDLIPKAERRTPNTDLHPSAFCLLPLQLAGALGPFWWMRGYFSEGRERLQALLAQSGYDLGSPEPGSEFRVARPVTNAPHSERCPPELQRAQVKALYYAGMLADDQGDYDAARALFQESLTLSRELGDPPGTARALNGLGALARHAGDGPAARALFQESLAIWREVGDRWWTAASLTNLGGVALLEGEEANARGLVESALEIQRQVGDRRSVARSLALLGRIGARLGDNERAQARLQESLAIVRELGARMPLEETLQALGQVALDRGDHDTARACYEERLAIAREIGSGWGIADSLYYLGLLASDRGEPSRAGSLWSESLGIFQTLGDKERIAACLEGLASLAIPPGQADGGGTSDAHTRSEVALSLQRAARLYGAAAALREAIPAPTGPRHRADYERHLAAARAVGNDTVFAAAWAEGRAMPLEQAIADALRGG